MQRAFQQTAKTAIQLSNLEQSKNKPGQEQHSCDRAEYEREGSPDQAETTGRENGKRGCEADNTVNGVDGLHGRGAGLAGGEGDGARKSQGYVYWSFGSAKART